jgi:hypothetical protein
MLHLEPIEMKNTYRSAVLSAELLRRSGEPAKAERVESLARILARELKGAAHSVESHRMHRSTE